MIYGRQLLSIFQENVLLRFIFIGAVNTAFGYSIFSLFIFMGVNYVLASLIASCIGTLFNFKTLGRIVFRQSDNKLIYRFVSVYVFLYFLGISVIKVGTYYLQNLYVLGAISTFITASTAFLLHRYFVFHRTSYATY
jgi:putative flippase GtrA